MTELARRQLEVEAAIKEKTAMEERVKALEQVCDRIPITILAVTTIHSPRHFYPALVNPALLYPPFLPRPF